MVSPQAVLIALAIALCIYVGEEVAVNVGRVKVLEGRAVSEPEP